MQYKILKLLSYLICLLPYRLILLLGQGFGRLYYRIAARQRKRAVAQMQESLQISAEQAERIAVNLFENLGRTFMEVMYMPAFTAEKMRRYVTVENRHYLQEALAEGRGVVLLTAHIGNWEWLGAALAMLGLPITTVIKRQPNDQHTQILNEYREMAGIEVFASGTSELVSAAKALKKGKILGFLADQDAGQHGVFVDFLGKPASTPLGPAVFAKRFRAPVVPVFIVREPAGGHKILVSQPLYYQDTGNEAQDLYRITEQMTGIIEAMIQQYPDHWLWFQKRWNTPPEAVKASEQQTAAAARRGQGA
ncbi:KDO2-lipid IV(A) lauroyltransferase [Dendrosporobacter quercicolus]|uniref:KDO2-lipid IV(A) lauroyltransferase n=1 Tax=Dendrosporobacter quercicolus TaxID=146817 RepID=A0A1G9WKH7_9FIRM|nr:KDO2-lipid IV(A) lauroyltransferase [Dendrosporobacter quercicolus]